MFQIIYYFYADDTALLAESFKELQRQTDSYMNHTYRIKWNLKMNISKSKIIIDSKSVLKENIQMK